MSGRPLPPLPRSLQRHGGTSSTTKVSERTDSAKEVANSAHPSPPSHPPQPPPPPPPAVLRARLPRQRSFELSRQLSTMELPLPLRRPWKTERLRRAVRLRSPHSPQGRTAGEEPPRSRSQRLRQTAPLNAWPLNWSPA